MPVERLETLMKLFRMPVARVVPVVPAVAVLLGAGLVLTGCKSQSHTCRGGGCHVTVSGAAQTVELDLLNDVEITVTGIDADAVTMIADSSTPVRLRNGESARVGSVTVQVTSIKGDTVKFDVS